MGSQLLAVASTLTGATRLQRSVMSGAKAADSTGDYDLFAVLTSRMKVWPLLLSSYPSACSANQAANQELHPGRPVGQAA